MKFFPAQKNPLIKTTLKIFFILVICFVVFFANTKIEAVVSAKSGQSLSDKFLGIHQGGEITAYKDTTPGANNQVYTRETQITTLTRGSPNPTNPLDSTGSNGGNTPYESTKIYKIDSATGKRTEISQNDLPKTLTELPVDPTILNSKDNSSGLSYDYQKGQYVYGQGDNAEYIDPANTTRLNEIGTSQNYKAAAEQAGKNTGATGDSSKTAPSGGTCGWDDPMQCLIDAFGWMVYYLLQILSSLVFLAGKLLDAIVSITIINLGGTTGTFSKIKQPVEDAWKILRDLINITFIFGLLYVSIRTILRTAGTDTKKLVSTIIISALFVNFSLFFTQVIIDFSNNFAVTIYNKINTNGGTISSSFMNQLNLQSLFKQGTGLYQIFFSGILGGTLIVITAFVFFVISLLLIVRFLTFIILMITSPVAIAGGVFPKIKDTVANDWWKNLFDQCMFAPVFFLMLWIVFKLMEGLNTVAPKADFAIPGQGTATDANPSLVALILRFVIIIGLLVQALIISKKFSASGAGALQSMALKYGQSAVLGGTGLLARNTVGWVANKGAERVRSAYQLHSSEYSKLDEEGKKTEKGMALKAKMDKAKLLMDAGSSVANRSFDARNMVPEGVRNTLGIDKGTGAGGYSKARADKEKEVLRKAEERNAWIGQSSIRDKKAYDAAVKDASGISEAKKMSEEHDEKKKKLEEQRVATQKDLDAAKEKEKTSPPNKKKGAMKERESAENKVKTVDEEIKKLNDNLVSSFKNINIDVDPKDAASLAAAKKAVDEKHNIISKKGGIGKAVLQTLDSKSVEELVDINRDIKASMAKGEQIAQASLNVLKTQSSLAKQQHAISLYDKKFSRFSKEASLKIRESAGKSPEQKAAELLIKSAKDNYEKEAKESPTGGTATSTSASASAPKPTTPAPVHIPTPPPTSSSPKI